jgi:hypothetical protein
VETREEGAVPSGGHQDGPRFGVGLCFHQQWAGKSLHLILSILIRPAGEIMESSHRAGSSWESKFT